MGNDKCTFKDKYEEYMKNFLCRLLRHDFVVSYINNFFTKNERTYYSFFMLMKVLGAHKDPKFQTNYWSDCYIYFYEKLGIHGILFIPLLLSKGSTDDKKKIIKKYLNEHINNTKEKITLNSNLVINLLEFKKVILTYVSCVSTRGLENVIKAMDNDKTQTEFLQNPEIKEEIKNYRKYFSNHLVESFVDVLLRPYSRQNYYVNAGKFIDDNIDFLTDDKNIRQRLREFSEKQSEISGLFKEKILAKNKTFDIQNKLEQIDNKTELFGRNKEQFNYDRSDIGGGITNDNNNINIINTNKNNINNNTNTKINNNSNIINTKLEQNDFSKSKNITDNSKLLFSSKSSNLNLDEPIKINESINNHIRIGKENKNMNEIKKNKRIQNNINNNNNSGKISFNMADFEVKDENVVKPLDIKGNNNINNKKDDNDSFSNFEESIKDEDIPKVID